MSEHEHKTVSNIEHKTPSSSMFRNVVTNQNANPCYQSLGFDCDATTTTQSRSKLFAILSDLNKYNIQLKSFPYITVIGPQSAGKTSVVEALCNSSIFPKGNGMVTMKPIFITLVRAEDSRTTYKVGDKEFINETDAKEEISRQNINSHIKRVEVTIKSPSVYNSYLIDLPGLFVISENNDPDFPKKIKQISIDHINDVNSIPVIVHSAPADPATNQALQLINRFNKREESFGIITKTDMVKNQGRALIEKMLAGSLHKLKYGYCAVVLRSDKDTENNMTIEEKIKKENEFFEKYTDIRPAGVETMRQQISKIQFEKIKTNIPQLVANIDEEIKKLSSGVSFLDAVISGKHTTLTFKLKNVIEKLVGSSLERAEFEENLKNEFRQVIETFKVDEKKEAVRTTAVIDRGICSYQEKNKLPFDKFDNDVFKNLFSYGATSVFISRDNVADAHQIESLIGSAIPAFDFVIDDPSGRKRLKWNQNLVNYCDNLLGSGFIENTVYKITEKLLLKYILISNTNGSSANPEEKFVEYLIKQISSEVYESKIKYSITAMINLEKRPNVSLEELVRKWIQMFEPSTFDFHSSFFDPKHKIKIEVYGEEWNAAYLQVVASKISENCYRNVAVNLLDKMIEKLLETTIDVFNKQNTLKEKNKITESIAKLQEARSTILEHMQSK
jgi:hypothetical protein